MSQQQPIMCACSVPTRSFNGKLTGKTETEGKKKKEKFVLMFLGVLLLDKNDSHQKPLKGHDPCSAFMTLITVASTQTRSHALRTAMSTDQRSLSSFCAFLMEPARKTRLCTWGLTPPLCCYTQDIIVPCTDDPVRQGQLQPTTRGCKS